MEIQSDTNETGKFYGVGVGPGDSELITLKAHRLIQTCDLVTYLKSDRGKAMARDIADSSITERTNKDQREHAIIMPMCNSREIANQAYDEGARVIAENLDKGSNVVFLCQGDPFFFGSFSYLHDRLGDRYPTEAIPGISSINACAALIGRAIGLLAENIAIVPGRRSDVDILKTLAEFDNVAIMKPGRRRQQLLDLIEQAGRSGDTSYIEYAGQDRQKIVDDISELGPGTGPYFSLFLIIRDRHTSD